MNYRHFLKLFWEFNEFIVSLHTLYLDSIAGYSILNERTLEHQDTMKALLGDCEVTSEAFQNKCSISYKSLSKNDFTVMAMSPNMEQGEVKCRTVKNGRNYILLGRQCVVSAYTYWEVYLRKEIGIALGVLLKEIKDKEEAQPILNKYVKSDFWGDMKWLRHSITHKNGIATNHIAKCKVLKWFNPGDSIDLDFDKMQYIFLQMGYCRNQLHSLSLPASDPIKISKS